MRLLIVDDATTDLDACRTSKERWNRSHSGESVISELVEIKTYPEARQYFKSHDACAIDGIILDLKLAEQADAGQLLIDDLNAMHRRMPIVVFTATQDPLSFQYLLGAFKKGDKPYDAAFERFEIAQEVGLTKILGCDGVIDRQLKDIFDKALTIKNRGGKVFAELGIVNHKLQKKFDIDRPVYFADLSWDALMKATKKSAVLFTELSKFPSVSRDLALLIDKNVEFAQIEQIARQTEKKLLKSVELFDVYEGKNLPEGKKSYAVNFILQDEQKTLNDKQIDAIMQKLIANLKKQLNAELR